MTYTRRKRDSKCYNPQKFEKVAFVENCLCTEENYECDTGFSRDGDELCTKADGTPISYGAPEKCDGYYWVS